MHLVNNTSLRRQHYTAFVRVCIVPGTGVFTTCTRTRAKTLAYAVGTTLLSLLDQGWTENLNANFISIVVRSRVVSLPALGTISLLSVPCISNVSVSRSVSFAQNGNIYHILLLLDANVNLLI